MAKKCICNSLPDSDIERKRNISFNFSYPNFEVPKHLKDFAKGKKYFIYTYGCQANHRDQEVMAGLLEKAGFSRVFSEKDSDLIILNTCAVRENAEQKVFGKIGDLIHLKKKNENLLIAVCGCMVQQKHIIEFISDKFKHVDLIFGTYQSGEKAEEVHNIFMAQTYEKMVQIEEIVPEVETVNVEQLNIENPIEEPGVSNQAESFQQEESPENTETTPSSESQNLKQNQKNKITIFLLKTILKILLIQHQQIFLHQILLKMHK